MPTAPLMQLPKTRSAEEFENMCADVLSKIYGCPFEQYGRQGQKQNGIDLIGSQIPSMHIVAQCKNYYALTYEKLRKQLIEDIEATENLPFSFQTFIGMTSLEQDVVTKDIILNTIVPFKVEIMFWEDIQCILSSDVKLLKKYYPYYFLDDRVPVKYKNELISIVNALKRQAQVFRQNYSNYRVAYHYNNDILIYNQCVSMYNAAIRLKQLQDQWYFQLKEKKLIKPIKNLIDSMPGVHDENLDGTGAAMICTITDYCSYFSDIENQIQFVRRCNKIIERIEKL